MLVLLSLHKNRTMMPSTLAPAHGQYSLAPSLLFRPLQPSTRHCLGMDGQSALTKLGFGVLAFNSALAIRNSWGDAGSVAFVLGADAALALLFLCLRRFERHGGGRNTKAAVWALTTLLTMMFAARVAPLMPPAVAALVWAMAAATAAGGFWAFFLN